MSFHSEVLGNLQKKVLRQLGPVISQWQFFLGGGTALAIHLGHRHSGDLDWFFTEPIGDLMRLAQDMRGAGIPLVSCQIERGILHGRISGVRVSFREYRYPLLEPPVIWPRFGCHIASKADLSCMKLSALTQRGSKKDFMDIYALGLKYRSLPDMLQFYQKKYSLQDIVHVLYALAFFENADRERMPKMLRPANWKSVKKTIQGWIKEMTR
jgi:hypothetical protein